MGRRRQPPSQTWCTFLRNHVGQIIAADFFVVPTVTCRLVFVLVLLAHERRRIRHVAVTSHPTAAWTTQQLREAFPWDEAPRYLIHDRDHAFDGLKATAKAMGIEEVVTAPHAPWQNPFVERFVGSAPRECFDHVIAFNEAGVRKLMRHYCSYYAKTRTHLALDKDAPVPRPVMRPGDGDILAILRSAASTIGTNAERPDRAAPNCGTQAAPQYCRAPSCDNQRRQPRGPKRRDLPTCSHRRPPRSGRRVQRNRYLPTGAMDAGGHGVQIVARDVPIGWQTDFLVGTGAR